MIKSCRRTLRVSRGQKDSATEQRLQKDSASEKRLQEDSVTEQVV